MAFLAAGVVTAISASDWDSAIDQARAAPIDLSSLISQAEDIRNSMAAGAVSSRFITQRASALFIR